MSLCHLTYIWSRCLSLDLRVNGFFIRFSVSLLSCRCKCFFCRNWEAPRHRHHNRYCRLTSSCHCWSSRRPSTRWSCESSTTCRHRRRLLPNSNTEWAHVFAGHWMPSLNAHEWRHSHAKVLSYEKRVESAGCTWRWCCSSAWPRCLSGGQEVPKIRNVTSPFFMFSTRYWRYDATLWMNESMSDVMLSSLPDAVQ